MKRHPDLDASLITIAALLVLGLAWLPGGVGELLSRLRVPAMSTRDADAVTAGYYEDLLDATAVRGATPSGLIRSMTDRAEPPADWPRLHETEGVVWDDDSYQRFTLRPGSTLDYKGAPLDINADGFRDRPFRERSDAGPRRIAIVGSSITMGSGVPVELTYENLLEDSLLEEGHDVEILNLAIAGYRGTQLLDVVLEWLEPLGVDGVLLVINDLTVNPRATWHVANLVAEGRDLRYPFLEDVVARSGADSGMKPEAILDRLQPFNDEVNAWWLGAATARLREMDVPFALLVIPQPATVEPLRRRVASLHPVFEALDVPVVSLYRAYDRVRDQSTLWLRPWDRHPTAEGHELLHEALLGAVRKRSDLRSVLLGEVTPDDQQ